MYMDLCLNYYAAHNVFTGTLDRVFWKKGSTTSADR